MVGESGHYIFSGHFMSAKTNEFAAARGLTMTETMLSIGKMELDASFTFSFSAFMSGYETEVVKKR